jgi:hypothetical protein
MTGLLLTGRQGRHAPTGNMTSTGSGLPLAFLTKRMAFGRACCNKAGTSALMRAQLFVTCSWQVNTSTPQRATSHLAAPCALGGPATSYEGRFWCGNVFFMRSNSLAATCKEDTSAGGNGSKQDDASYNATGHGRYRHAAAVGAGDAWAVADWCSRVRERPSLLKKTHR